MNAGINNDGSAVTILYEIFKEINRLHEVSLKIKRYELSSSNQRDIEWLRDISDNIVIMLDKYLDEEF